MFLSTLCSLIAGAVVGVILLAVRIVKWLTRDPNELVARFNRILTDAESNYYLVAAQVEEKEVAVEEDH